MTLSAKSKPDLLKQGTVFSDRASLLLHSRTQPFASVALLRVNLLDLLINFDHPLKHNNEPEN